MGICSILEVDEFLIEIARPFPIRRRLRMDPNDYVGHSAAIDMNVGGVIEKHVDNGEIAAMFRESWKSKAVSIVSNLRAQ